MSESYEFAARPLVLTAAARPAGKNAPPSRSRIDPKLALDFCQGEGAASPVVRKPLFDCADCLFGQLFLGLASVPTGGRQLAWASPCRRYPFKLRILRSPQLSLLHDE